MSKVIEVEKCLECPFFRSEDNVPYCNHPKVGHQIIEYDKINDAPFRVPKQIPDWCPLEDAEDFAESNFDIDRKF